MKYTIEIPDGKYCGDCPLMNHDSEWGERCNLTGDKIHDASEVLGSDDIELLDKTFKSKKCPGAKK